MAAIFCIPTMGGLRGYKIWQPHFVSPSYSVSPQFRGVMGGGTNSKHSQRGIKLPLFGLIGLSQASQVSLSDQLLI